MQIYGSTLDAMRSGEKPLLTSTQADDAVEYAITNVVGNAPGVTQRVVLSAYPGYPADRKHVAEGEDQFLSGGNRNVNPERA